MKNFLRIFVFLLCFSFFGCLGIIDESLISSVSFEITIPESIEKQSSSARTATTDNLKLRVDLETKDSEEVRTEEKNVSEGETVSISFEEIPVESEIRLVGKLFDSESNVLYSGESEWVVIQSGKNTVNLEMKKVITEDDTEGGDNTGEDDNTDDSEPDDKVEETPKDVIVDAAEPTEVMDLTPFVFVKGSDVTSTTLQCSGMSTDEGVITFQWDVKNANGEWEPLVPRGNEQALDLYVSILEVFATDFEVNEVKDYRCIVTNTNDKVNGNKTASVTKYTTIAYVEGILSSMTAEYKNDCYEIFGTDFTYENINVTEEWISGENSFKFTIPASNTRYEVKQNSTTGESVIGAVPYTITYIGGYANAETSLSQELKIPVKYLLKTAELQLSSYFNDSYVSTSEDDKTLKVPQYGTVEYELGLSKDVSLPIKIINADETTTTIEKWEYSNEYYSTKIYKDGTLIENDASCEVAGVYKYKLAIKSENEWFVCEENNTKEFDVEVYKWEMTVEVSYYNPSNTDETIVATQNASGNYVVPNTVQQCYVSAKTNIDGISPVVLSLESNDVPNTSGYFFPGTIITVKFGDNEIGTVTVVSATVGSEDFPVTDWTVLTSLVDPDEATDEPITIYVSGTITATEQAAFINRPVTIIPKGNVKITRSSETYVFSVNKNFSVRGEKENTLTISDSSTQNNYPLISCTQVDVTVSFSNCIFENAKNTDSYGSVLYVSGKQNISLENCEIKNNNGSSIVLSQEEDSSIKFVDCSFVNNATDITVKECYSFTLSGLINISSLYFENSPIDNVYPQYNVECENLSGMVVIKAEDYDNLTLFENGTTLPNGVFSLADSNYRFTADGQVEFVSGGGSGSDSNITVVDVNTLKSAISNAGERSVDNPYVIAVSGNSEGYIDLSETMEINSHIKLIPAGNTDVKIGRNPEITGNNLFVINSNASLTLGDDNSTGSIIIDGGSENYITSTKSLINVASGGTLVLNENSVLQNNLCNGTQGGAVYSNGGTINIYGGYISSNTIDDTNNARYGGGIYLKNGSFTMTSGKFSSNSINSNDSEKSAYGGALALESCTVNISGGEFTANFVKTNTTECYGGAIYILGSSSSSESNPHSISNCTFTANSAYQRGAAIYGAGSGYLNIKNCDFSNNAISNEEQGLQTGGTIYKGNGSSITILIDEENKFENTQVWNP